MTTMPDMKHARASRLADLVAGNPALLGVAAIGFTVSFQTIAALAAAHHLPGWPVLYPILIDVGLLAMIIESRRAIDARRSDLAPRVLAWALIGLTLYVNAHGAPPHDWLGRALHVTGPALWAALLELTRWRKLAKRRAGQGDRIPRARWLIAPWRTLGMRRRMIEHNVTSYPVACAREEARLAAISLMPAVWGRDWKRTAPALLRHHLASGTLPSGLAASCSAAAAGYIPATGELAEDWVTSAKAATARVSARARRDERAAAPDDAPAVTPAPRQVSPRPRPAGGASAGDSEERVRSAIKALGAHARNEDLARHAAPCGVRTVQRVKQKMRDAGELPAPLSLVAGGG